MACSMPQIASKTALAETIHHHERFMARTAEPEGWTSQFREIALDVKLEAHDLRGDKALLPDGYAESQSLAADLRAAKSDGIVYPSCRQLGGECVALFYPDLAANPVQGRHLDHHWNGARVDLYREVGSGAVYRIKAEA